MSMGTEDIRAWIASQQPGYTGIPTAATTQVNRSGPATPPPLPLPNNPIRNPSPYMAQALSLSGVPQTAPMQQRPTGYVPRNILQYLQALGGGMTQAMPQGGVNPQMLQSLNPQLLAALQALQGRM